MPAFAGPLVTALRPIVPLVAIPLASLAGALVVALSGSRLSSRRAALVGLGSTALALAFAIADVAELFSLDPSRRLFGEGLANLVRIGSLDVNLAFALDPLASAFLLASLVVTLLVQGFTYKNNARASAGFVATTSLFLLGASVAVLAANAVLLLFGFALVAVATSLLLRSGREGFSPMHSSTRPLFAACAGDASLVLGFALLFWGLGGAWPDEGRFLSDYRARFVAAHAEGRLPVEDKDADDDDDDDDKLPGERDPRVVAARAGKKGALTFTSHPGARVYLGVADVAQLAQNPEPFGVSPFVRKDIPAGAHSVVIVPGGGATIAGDGHEVAWIERLVVTENEEVRLVPVGSTVTFREIEDQLLLRDESGKSVLRASLVNKKGAGSIGLVTLASILLFLGALSRSAALPLFPWLVGAAKETSLPALALVQGAGLSLGVYLMVRLGTLLSMSSSASTVVLVVALLSALVAGLFAARSRRLDDRLAYASLVVLGVAFACVGLDEPLAAVAIALVHGLGVSGYLTFGLLSKKLELADRASTNDLAERLRVGELVVEGSTGLANLVGKIVSTVDEIFVGAPARLIERAFFPEGAPPAEAPEPTPAPASASAPVAPVAHEPLPAGGDKKASAPTPVKKQSKSKKAGKRS